MLQELKFSRQLFAVIISIPTLLIIALIFYFNREQQDISPVWLSVILGVVLLVTILVSALYVNRLSLRILHIKNSVAELAEGKQNAVPIEGDDEVAAIAISLNQLTSSLKETAEFTRQIGEGNLTANFQPASDSDLLGHSLLKMKDDLVALKAEDEKRIWATESLARFAAVLQSNRNLKTLSDKIIKNLVTVLNVNQGAVFILNDDQPQDPFLEMKSCYAYNRAKFLAKRVEIGNGILGQVFLEKRTLYLKKVPKDYVHITSGLGDAAPRCVIIVPLKVNDTMVGLIELASFKEFEKYQIAFMENLGENIAHAVTSFRISDNTAKLLAESQHQAEQMKSQEEELRQNQEELQATQEEINRKYNALFKQLTELTYDSKFDQLKSINFTKKRSVEYYFDIIRNQIITFSENKTVVEAIKAFRTAFYQIEESSADKMAKMKTSLLSYYENDFLPKLNDNATDIKTPEDYLPQELRALTLQYLYISSNQNPTGEKHLLNDAKDGSAYSAAHAEFHPLMKNFLEKFGYYDIFLIDHETGDMLYSVFKEVDFATSLLTGIYKTTNFGRVVKQAVDSTDLDFVKLVDFEPYDPSYLAPASFIASPIYDHGKKIGILVFQMPINKINQILTGNNKWEEDGLGATGETFMVGEDHKLRSISRGLTQDSERYLSDLRANGYSSAVVNQIQKTNTCILLEEVKNESSEKALRGLTGTQVDQNSQGAVLCAYTPLQIKDMNWVLMSTMSETEVSEKIYALRQL
ncbi:MAG TPA: GAF domain-containing protein [Chryseolinea sp.]|nr:GAF domain-containing protein [Chryseolinea sp.]HPM29820.1 GAF domain-containing protein [Chryseolinea sp.]